MVTQKRDRVGYCSVSGDSLIEFNAGQSLHMISVIELRAGICLHRNSLIEPSAGQRLYGSLIELSADELEDSSMGDFGQD